MKTSLEFESIPWIFLHIIPTKLEVDGIKYSLNHKIDLMSISKSYGHYRFRIIFVGLIKTKALVVESNKAHILIHFKFQNKKWYYYLLSTAVTAYLLFLEPQSKLTLLIASFVFFLFLFINMLANFVHIQETNPPA
ncbi:hypothetical protein [Aquirufa ecclesiirivi]|uniref:hypothetical protein n=1 Tax=Aquirufa ecclesiirivi TaxID=2715124 RepID=UPI003BB01C1E